MVTGISAASTGGVLVYIKLYDGYAAKAQVHLPQDKIGSRKTNISVINGFIDHR